MEWPPAVIISAPIRRAVFCPLVGIETNNLCFLVAKMTTEIWYEGQEIGLIVLADHVLRELPNVLPGG